MDTDIIDYDNLTDEELDALDGSEQAGEGDLEQADPAAGPDPQPTEEGAADPAQATEPEPTEQRPETRAVPLSEHQAMRQRAQEAEERERALAEKARRTELQAQYYQILAEEGVEAADAWADRVNAEANTEATVRQRETQIRTQAEQRVAVDRLMMSADLARQHYGEERFTSAYSRLCQLFGATRVDEMAAQQPNPGRWVVEFHDTELAPSPEARKQAIADEVAKQVQEALSKNQPPAHRANPASSVAHVKANAGPAIDDLDALDPDDLTDAQHAALEQRDRERLRRR